jgi:hypothetical protein
MKPDGSANGNEQVQRQEFSVTGVVFFMESGRLGVEVLIV